MKKLFAGRMNRTTYLLANTIVALVAIVASRPDVEQFFNEHNGITLLFVLFIALPLIAWQFAVTARRLHDRSVSGWLSLLIVLPGVQLVLLILPGRQGANQYGLQPTQHFDLSTLVFAKQSSQ